MRQKRGSESIKGLRASASEDTIYFGQVGIVEIAAALSRKVRTHELNQEEYEAALWVFLMDVRNEAYVIAPLSDHIIELAVDLTRRHPLRGYDAVHLATAMTLNTTLLGADLPPLVFVASDARLCEAAQGERLSTENPNDH
jgi:predicted nucleic acid-binding protein